VLAIVCVGVLLPMNYKNLKQVSWISILGIGAVLFQVFTVAVVSPNKQFIEHFEWFKPSIDLFSVCGTLSIAMTCHELCVYLTNSPSSELF